MGKYKSGIKYRTGAAKARAAADISGWKRGTTGHYSTLSRAIPPIYPGARPGRYSGSLWDLMKLYASTNLVG